MTGLTTKPSESLPKKLCPVVNNSPTKWVYICEKMENPKIMKILPPEMEECLANCLNCHRVCFSMATTHCLELGGEHVAPDHLRLVLLCAEICQTSAKFLMAGSPLHREACRACAAVCSRCADDCERIGDMEECARACRACADSCKKMSH